MTPAPRAYLQDIERLVALGRPWSGLGGDALAYALSRLPEGRWLVVVDDADRLERVLKGLRFFGSSSPVLAFPGDDGRPYDGFSPDPGLARERIRALRRAERGRPVLVVATGKALLQRVPDQATRDHGTLVVRRGDVLDRDVFIRELAYSGYLAAGRAEVPSSFAARGDVVDVWPAGASRPVRIDFFDDEVESVRRLDPQRLRPVRDLDKVRILPAREERLDPEAVTRLKHALTQCVTEQGRGVGLRRRVVEDLQAGIRFSALEDYLPALVPTIAPLDGLAGLHTFVVDPDDVAAGCRDHLQQAQQRWEALADDERPLVSPAGRFVTAEAVMSSLEQCHPIVGLSAEREGAYDFGAEPASGLSVRGKGDLGPLVKRIEALASADMRVALVVDHAHRATAFTELLAPHGLEPPHVDELAELERGDIGWIVGDLSQGFVCEDSGWAVIPVSTLFGQGAKARSERAHALFETSVTHAEQLRAGDLVVHRRHGVGRYRGLVRLAVNETDQDFVELEYRGGDLLYLPVTSLDQLSRYTPSRTDAAVRLDRLGGATWEARKGKVRDNLLHMAQDLLKLYARRELATRPPLRRPGAMSRAFEACFPHVETPDQATAIDAVSADLERPYPMDRLVVGDVGFGKTEVAMRATMRMVEAGRQVAILCPTTVLAHQHLHTFTERFADFDVGIAMLSRFNDPVEDRAVRKGLREGRVQIVIGTTALLGRSVKFADLGLIVVDEEHRFGVSQKERLKRMRAEVDVLAMSATPIPRTLQMALSGVREMSVIATPPKDRLAVRTSVARLTQARVSDALRQELARQGQAYVIHNRVETIGRFTERLRRWVPEARFGVAHGQMDSETLESVLVKFIEREVDVLVCTSIVESGIDLPNVNTMLVDRADRFGLAQLYQLRGRVGRSDVRASCILLTPEDPTRDARKRLRVLVENTQLGSGFQIAAADLELRGGGNILGAAQSGNIDKVGYETWVELLEEAVRSARGTLDQSRIDPEVEVPIPAFLPDTLLPDVEQRLSWYRRFGDAVSEREVDVLVDELEGEQGELPAEARNLATLAAIKLRCRELRIVRCAWLKIRCVLELHISSPLCGAGVEALVVRHPKRFAAMEVNGAPALEVRFTPREGERPAQYLRWVFAQLRAVLREGR
ncbi:MAG: transcription-repair coupling factor (superfamily II helicase) [Myxococcota bacterium]|jgi:transcription-repair coupling factor (superfamily II helicase)